MNIHLMKVVTYLLFAVMMYLSHKDFQNFYKKDYDLHSNKKEIIKYINKCEIRIGIILFFIMTNIIIIATNLNKILNIKGLK
ncbi:hypothetical protein [Hathewaya limosa]|uniref:Uncharacterized protein n=1 Tax=Hathewaya limosa TaxID=1536 RepID=A0ABU0JTD2_HATLI|nr:hypothetical protein [Hathewaya limosa]AWZ49920.1 hypothetical protein C3495_13785 [Clostridiaceae bacterium 14S0207]MDQ0480345.1 hypothetical protein [Hathewaya limosa]